MNPINIYNTYINPNAIYQIGEVLKSTMLSEGKLVKQFENTLHEQLGILNPIAVNSGTTALHLALLLANVKAGDEVIIPAQTFVATGLAVLYVGAIPVFADINYLDGNIDPISIKSKITNKTKAIIPVHWGGYPCDMDAINTIAKENNLIVIEDAAHAIGATYYGKPIGSLSDFTCFSFQAIKHITTGDGGALACQNPEIANKALVKRWFGIDRNNAPLSILGERQYNISTIGYKYHLNDYNAALGLSNLIGFEQRVQNRRYIAAKYFSEFENIDGIKLFLYDRNRSSSYWLFGMHVENRTSFIQALKDKNIATSVIHQRIDRNSIFGELRKDLEQQVKFDLTQIHIPDRKSVV